MRSGQPELRHLSQGVLRSTSGAQAFRGVTGDCTHLAKFGEFSSSCVGSTQDPLSPILYEVALVTGLKFVNIRRHYLIGTKCTITTR